VKKQQSALELGFEGALAFFEKETNAGFTGVVVRCGQRFGVEALAVRCFLVAPTVAFLGDCARAAQALGLKGVRTLCARGLAGQDLIAAHAQRPRLS
jgi:hypothetical protein